MKHLGTAFAATILLSATACGPQNTGGFNSNVGKLDPRSQFSPSNSRLNPTTTNLPTGSSTLESNGGLTDVLPDMVPWNQDEIQGPPPFGMATANSNDRLVSCDDWTYIDPTPITGQRIITFQLGSANLGLGHLRLRRGPQMPDGWHFFQTTSQMDGSGMCSAVETEIAVVPPNNNNRWLPLAWFALYQMTEDGGLGDLVVCQMKRWCCLGSQSTCNNIHPPCSLTCSGDCINAGTRDVYPFHWQDQFVPIQNVPSGTYWFEHRINPAGLLIESDYTNNSVFFQVTINQEANTVDFIPPYPTECPNP
jgi:hypothetical protein